MVYAIPVYNLILDCTASQDGQNKFGQKPAPDSGVVTNKRPSRYAIILAVIVGIAAILSAVSAASSDGLDWSDGYSSSSYSSSDSSSSDSYVESVLNDTEEFVAKFEKAYKKRDSARMKQLLNSGEAAAIGMQIEVIDEDDMTYSQQKRMEKLAARLDKMTQAAFSY